MVNPAGSPSPFQENINTKPPAPFQGGKNIAGGGIASEANEKVANPLVSSRKRQLDFCGGQHKCQICGKPFQSEKGVHGHMKMHKGKKASGAFPLPAFTHLERGDAGVADAVQLATVRLNSSTQQVHSASASALTSSSKHLVIDLNRPQPPDVDVLKKERLFDLNKLPSPEKENGDDGDNNMEYN